MKLLLTMMEWKASDNIKRTRKENILLLNYRGIRDTWRNMWRQRSFCASGCPAILLMNPSRPARRSSMKSSSNIPAKKMWSWLQDGETIHRRLLWMEADAWWPCWATLAPRSCCPSPTRSSATQSQRTVALHLTLSLGTQVGLSALKTLLY